MRPVLGFMQAAWVVPDIEAAVNHWVKSVGVGPFFLIPHVQVQGMLYRDQPVSSDFSVALAQSGPLQIELIQQHDEGPSVYRDTFPGSTGGFHHVCRFTHDFDAELEGYRKQGIAVATTGVLGDMRFAYVDTRAQLSHMVEIIEDRAAIREIFKTVADAAVDWNGDSPIRSL